MTAADRRPGPASSVVVTDDAAQHRYEIHVDGVLAGVADYRAAAGHRTFTHTEIDPRYAGRGLGSRLAAAALDDLRAHGLTITAHCAFIARYVAAHPEYQDLIGPHEAAPS